MGKMLDAFQRLLALGDIARNLGCAYDVACAIPHRGYRNGDIDGLIVLSPSDGLKMINRFPALDEVHDSAFFLQTVGRNHREYGTAYDLPRAVSKNPVSTSIPPGYDSIEILDNDCIV